MKVGLVGLGRVAEHHIRALIEISGLELVAVMDSDKDRLAQDFIPRTVQKYSEIEQFLIESSAEAVIVATPPSSHGIISRQVIDSEKHLILEKPTTHTLEEFDDLSSRADSKGVLFHTLFHAGHAPDLKWYLENLHGEFSPEAFSSIFQDPYLVNGRITSPQLEGSWRDSGINALSVVVQLFDDLLPISASSLSRYHFEVETIAKFPSNGEIKTMWYSGRDSKVTLLIAEDRTIELNHSTMTVNELIENGRRELYRCSSKVRLTEHYIQTLSDALAHLDKKQDNREFSRRCHVPYFAVQQLIH